MRRPRTEVAKALSKWLSGLKRSTRMVWRSGSFAWSREIEARLREWCASIDDPRDGCLLLLDFFRGDDVIFCLNLDSAGFLVELGRIDQICKAEPREMSGSRELGNPQAFT